MSSQDGLPSSKPVGLEDGAVQHRDERFPKAARLLDSADFRRVTASGRKMGGRYFLLFILETVQPHSRLGLTVSRKVGNAVVRNGVKRQMRAFFRVRRLALTRDRTNGWDMVWIARPQAGGATMEALRQDLQKLFSALLRSSGAPQRESGSVPLPVILPGAESVHSASQAVPRSP